MGGASTGSHTACLATRAEALTAGCVQPAGHDRTDRTAVVGRGPGGIQPSAQVRAEGRCPGTQLLASGCGRPAQGAHSPRSSGLSLPRPCAGVPKDPASSTQGHSESPPAMSLAHTAPAGGWEGCSNDQRSTALTGDKPRRPHLHGDLHSAPHYARLPRSFTSKHSLHKHHTPGSVNAGTAP